MPPKARWMPILLLAAWPLLGQTPPVGTAPKESHFRRGQSEIRSLNLIVPGCAFLAGPNAIYEQSTDILH